MDIYCANCGEPTDTYHVQHDLLWDTDLPEHVIESQLTRGLQLNNVTRPALERIGWTFGNSIFDVRHCDACSWHEEQGHELGHQLEDRIAMRDALYSVLGDDPDAMAAEMSDLQL